MAAVSVEEAFAYCEARTKAHYENFPVGLFVPRKRRPYVYALYAFARTADDFADEPIYEGMRREKLEDWERLLDAAYRGEAQGPIFVALGETVRRFGIPKQLLLDLLSAFRQDVEKTRYASWEELLDYCRRSAEPVGRLVLLVFEQPGEDLPALSDAICTGLQLANHWQDAAIDYGRGRIYVPEDVMRRHGVGEWDFRSGRVSDGWRGMMGELISRTRELFERGRPLCDRVSRELRFEMRLTWLGGMSILDRIEATGGDVFRQRPHHGLLDKAALGWRAWRWPAP
jgi:phytoene synthase